MSIMYYEFYFAKNNKKISMRSWMDFMECKANNNNFYSSYQKYTPDGQGRKEVYGFNPNGEVLFFDNKGKRYKGIWFDTSDTRISILQTGIFNGNI